MKKKILATVTACALAASCACAGLSGCAAGGNSGQSGTAAAPQTQNAELTAERIADGSYAIEVESSSSMFRVVKAELIVEGQEMSCIMTLSGTGYGKLYMGTGEQAASASKKDFIPFAEDAEGAYTYTVPVSALDTSIDCAAWSIRKEQWYDRVLVFKSDSLPAEARLSEPKQVSAPQGSVALAQGGYEIGVTLSGGSGKATVESPAMLTVTDSGMTARIVWSSPNYDLMVVDGTEYLPVNKEGNSVFEIPVSALDEELAVSAETVAMSKPHMIDYTLLFDSASAVAKG